jgi:intracellular sulfur oxidation DsrE/DsrF family protein
MNVLKLLPSTAKSMALALLVAGSASAQWPEPKSPVIPEADGYVLIPNAAVRPRADHVYKAVFDATGFPKNPASLLPSVNNLSAELNALGVEGIPPANAKFAIVFHGPSVDGLLDSAHYKSRFGVANPNLKVLAELKRLGVELFVCGQNLAAEKVDPRVLTPDVRVASDAFIVLMEYQNNGYALLNY